MVFNYQGSFDSEGLFSFDNCQHDIDVALSFLKQKSNIKRFSIDTSRIVICGYSLGGAMALTAATHNPDINNIISIAGVNDQAIYLTKMVLYPAYRAGFEQRIISTFSPRGPIKGDSMYIHDCFETIIPEVDRYDLLKNAEQRKELKVLFLVAGRIMKFLWKSISFRSTVNKRVKNRKRYISRHLILITLLAM